MEITIPKTEVHYKKRACPICGKAFYTRGTSWGYKWRKVCRKKETVEYFCSWGCLREWERRHPETPKESESWEY